MRKGHTQRSLLENLEPRCLLSATDLLPPPSMPAWSGPGTIMPAPTVEVKTATELLAVPDRVKVGEMLKLVATVRASDGSIPVGRVTFLEGNPMSMSPLPPRVIGQALLGADGRAVLPVHTAPVMILGWPGDEPMPGYLGAGFHHVYARYEGMSATPVTASEPMKVYLPSESNVVGVEVVSQTSAIVRLMKFGAATTTHAPTFVAVVANAPTDVVLPVPIPEIPGTIQSAKAVLHVNNPPAPEPVLPPPPTDTSVAPRLNVAELIAPAGKIVFYDGDVELGSAPLSNGVAVFTPDAPLALGRQMIVAVYYADDGAEPVKSAALPVEVTLARTVTRLATSSPAIPLGKPFTWTAVVSNAEKDFAKPTGTVSFQEGDKVLATVQLDGEPVTVTLPLLPGVHRIVAVYSGDDKCLPSRSNVIEQVILPAPEHRQAVGMVLKKWGPSTVTNPPILTATLVRRDGSLFGAEPNPAIPGQIMSASANLNVKLLMPNIRPTDPPVTTNATGSVSGGLLSSAALTDPPEFMPTGEVRFYEGRRLLGAAAVVDGTATFVPSGLRLGFHAIRAVYSGDARYLPFASKPIAVEITLARTATKLASSAAIVRQGGSFTLSTAVSTVNKDTVPPTGFVTIFDGRRKLATLKLGAADQTVALFLKTGRHELFAFYWGDKNCQASRSAVVVVTVEAPPTITV